MKKLFIISIVLILTACDKVPINGNLDGMWQLMAIQDNVTSNVSNVKDSRLYYSFQLHLVQLNNGEAYAHFSHRNDSIVMYDWCDGSPTNNKIIDTTVLNKFGLYDLRDSFKVELLTHEKMQLRSRKVTLSFRKF
ncbi:MAG: lipocalin family protein [Bacteroidales bacterium]|nr:lipocalin family protein [Bacteroidales bacterium]